MTTLFQISLGYDEVNHRYVIAAYNAQENEVTTATGTINKVWREIGDRIKSKEKDRKNFPLPQEEPSIIHPNGSGKLELPADRKIIVPG